MPRPFNPESYPGWRKLVLMRDNYTCVICGSKDKLECDHILSVRTHNHLIYSVDNGRTLCAPCHRKTDTYGGKALKGTRRSSYATF